MRLELEQNQPHSSFADGVSTETAAEERAAEAANHLREGIRAAQAGNRSAARTSLLRAAEIDPQSESAWLWLSSISEYPEELLAFLTNVLEINPHNARALEWSAATKSLLAKNFVQRGIDAAESNQTETASQHFNQALEYDEKNSMAWLWLASLCDSNEGKLSYLEKVLEFDSENDSAKAGYEAARNGIREKPLAEARTAAVAGDSVSANELLDAVIAEQPDAEDAWVLKSHIAVGFEEKIAAFERILEINPANQGAKAGLESLSAIMAAVAPQAAIPEEQPDAVVVAGPENVEDVQEAPELNFQMESVDDQDVVVTVAAEIETPTAFDEVAAEETYAPSPFDSYADDSAVDFGKTVTFSAADLEAVQEISVETVSDQAGLDSVSYSDESGEADYRLSDSETFNVSPEPPTVAEPEEITYELAPEAVEFVEPEFSPVESEEVTALSANPAEELEEAPAVTAPSSNPFDSAAFKNESDEFKTLVSIPIDAETFDTANSYEPSSLKATNAPAEDKVFDTPFDVARYSGTIPMPSDNLEYLTPLPTTGFETRVVAPTEFARPQSSTCPFCSAHNDGQVITCQNCLAVLTLADLELILANHHADKAILRETVERMEREKASREFDEAELTMLGIGHLNLRNLQYGYNYLHEASQKNPNNVVLSGQVNALLIRLEEIRQQAEVHEAMSKGKTILVVDDSPTVRKLIAGKLEKCGHEVFCSGDGIEAMERLSDLRPDLILLDITMPRMDGYQVCKLIRGNEATKDVPVVMISGKDGFFDKVRGRMAGTSGYITKPFGPETLMKAVESYLSPAS